MQDVENYLKRYFQLNETERRIVQTVCRMDDTPGSRSVLALYFPGLPPESLLILKDTIRALTA